MHTQTPGKSCATDQVDVVEEKRAISPQDSLIRLYIYYLYWEAIMGMMRMYSGDTFRRILFMDDFHTF